MPKIKFDNGVVMTLDREPSSQEIEDLGKIAMSQGRPPINQQLKPVFPEIPAEEQVKHPYLTAMAKTSRDVAAIPAHFANQFFLDYPRRVTEHFGYEYPSETKNIAAGAAAKIAGVAGGLKNPIFRTIGGVGQGLGKNILAGAATGVAYSPSKFESPLQVAGEQITKAIGGALLPLAGKAITKVTPAIRGAGEYVFSKGAGLSRTTLNTFNRLGYGKIRNIASRGINYIQEDVIPRARQNLLKNITTAGDASKEILQDMGFNPDQIKDVMRISPDNMKKYGNLISQNWVKTEENIAKALSEVGKKIGKVYAQAAKEGQRINVRNTLSTMRQQLKNYGMMDDTGNLLGDYKTHPSTSIRNLAQLYSDYASRIGKGDISVSDFMNFRTRLEASITKVVENEKFNVPVYIIRKALKKDSINSLMMKGSPYEKFWRGINKEYSDLKTIDYLSKKINSVVNNLPERIMTQRNKLTDKHLRLYGRDIVNDIDAYNAAKELYPEKETLGLFNFQKPLVRTALKATGVAREAARPVTAPLGQAARNIGQFGASRLKQYIESPMIGPSTQRMIQGKKGQIPFGGQAIRGQSPPRQSPQGKQGIVEGKPLTAAEAVKQGMGAEEFIQSSNLVEKESIIPKTGSPFSFSYIRNTEKSPYSGSRFGQDVEPHGKYMTVGRAENIKDMPNMEHGAVRFDNPLVLEFGGGYGEETNWKIALSKKYGGKVGAELTKAIKKDGYDGIVTVSKSGKDLYTSEILDLGGKSIKTKSQLLSEYEAAKVAEGQNPLRNKSGQAFIGGGQESSPILAKSATSIESTSQSAKNKVFQSIPEKEGMQVVYMPYGPKGKGFYYVSEKGRAGFGILGPTMATGIGLAAALKATAARGESSESLDPEYKQQIANAENYGKTEGDWAQLEDIALRDLKRIGKLKQNITLKQVKADPQLYDKVAKLYWDRLDAFGIPDKDKALWWLMPGRYRQTGGDISRLKNPEHRNIMRNRIKNIGGGK